MSHIEKAKKVIEILDKVNLMLDELAVKHEKAEAALLKKAA